MLQTGQNWDAGAALPFAASDAHIHPEKLWMSKCAELSMAAGVPGHVVGAPLQDLKWQRASATTQKELGWHW